MYGVGCSVKGAGCKVYPKRTPVSGRVIIAVSGTTISTGWKAASPSPFRSVSVRVRPGHSLENTAKNIPPLAPPRASCMTIAGPEKLARCRETDSNSRSAMVGVKRRCRAETVLVRGMPKDSDEDRKEPVGV